MLRGSTGRLHRRSHVGIELSWSQSSACGSYPLPVRPTLVAPRRTEFVASSPPSMANTGMFSLETRRRTTSLSRPLARSSLVAAAALELGHEQVEHAGFVDPALELVGDDGGASRRSPYSCRRLRHAAPLADRPALVRVGVRDVLKRGPPRLPVDMLHDRFGSNRDKSAPVQPDISVSAPYSASKILAACQSKLKVR
jgi:hypothetical protein